MSNASQLMTEATGGRDSPTRGFGVLFEWDSAAINASAYGTIEDAMARATGCDLRSLRIVGNTDASHDEACAMALTKRMATMMRREMMLPGLPADAVTIEPRAEPTFCNQPPKASESQGTEGSM